MRTQWSEGSDKKKVTSPVSLIVSAFASLADVRGTLTPQLNATEADTTLVLIDLGKGQNRMGGSILGQTLDQSGDVVPDVDDPKDLVNLVNAVNALRAKGQILAYHDRSDGGLLAAAAEMAFAGHVGVALNVDMLVTEGDGISDSRMDTGDAKNWAGQVGARREELTLKALFNEELGVVLQVRTAERNEVMQTLREHGLSKFSHFVGKTRPASSEIDAGKGELQVWRDAKAVIQCPLADLHQVWDAVSWKICQQRDNPANADAEHAAAGEPTDPGMHVHLTFDATDNVAAPYLNLAKPKVAILREQGVNSHIEMAYAFTEAGFEAYDVHMTDLQTGRVKLEDFKGVVACGGFSYGDTLGRGHRLGAFHHLQPRAGRAVPGLLWPPGHVWPGRVQRLPDVCRAGRHHPRRARLATLHHQPERALRGPPVAGGSARITQPVPARHGRQPPADRGGAW